MNSAHTTDGTPRPNNAQPRTNEGHELAPQARVAVAATVVTAARPC